MKRIVRSTLETAVNLVFFATIGTAILATTYFLTRDTITATVAAAKLKLITQLLPADSYDNDIMRDTLTLPADILLGTDDPSLAHIARRNGEPVAVILEVVAREGYSGDIQMVLGIRSDGALSGVRVVNHKETPGLGDYIDIAKNDWIRVFEDKRRGNDADWKVKKDGGQFDSMSGATITPRAVVKASHLALQYFDSHRAELLPQTKGTRP
ncbi:MAG: electron transport complex subunit RsxG [Sideroxydans sp.]|jgi:electron transport complex protein RnfG